MIIMTMMIMVMTAPVIVLLMMLDILSRMTL